MTMQGLGVAVGEDGKARVKAVYPALLEMTFFYRQDPMRRQYGNQKTR